MRKIGPKFSHFGQGRGGWPPLPLTVSLTIKYKFFLRLSFHTLYKAVPYPLEIHPQIVAGFKVIILIIIIIRCSCGSMEVVFGEARQLLTSTIYGQLCRKRTSSRSVSKLNIKDKDKKNIIAVCLKVEYQRQRQRRKEHNCGLSQSWILTIDKKSTSTINMKILVTQDIDLN